MKNKQSHAIPFEEWKKKLLEDPEVKKSYDALEPEYEIASQIIEARIKQKMSTEMLAEKAGVKKSVITRLEGMNAKPSISLLQKIAQALNTKITITI